MKILKVDGATHIEIGDKIVAQALECSDAIDSFQKLSDIAYLWKRKSIAPVTQMKMHLTVPCDTAITELPFSQSTLPMLAYTETGDTVIALIEPACDSKSEIENYRERFCQNHVMIWPKEEGDIPCRKNFSGDAFSKSSDTRREFEVIVVAYKKDKDTVGTQKLLDFISEYYK